jgi:hypothetical protein
VPVACQLPVEVRPFDERDVEVPVGARCQVALSFALWVSRSSAWARGRS